MKTANHTPEKQNLSEGADAVVLRRRHSLQIAKEAACELIEPDMKTIAKEEYPRESSEPLPLPPLAAQNGGEPGAGNGARATVEPRVFLGHD